MAQEFSSSDKEDDNEILSSTESDFESEKSFEPDDLASISSEPENLKNTSSSLFESYNKLPPHAKAEDDVSFIVCDKKTKTCSRVMSLDKLMDHLQTRFVSVRLIENDEWAKVFDKGSRRNGQINAIRELLSQSKELLADTVKRHLLIAENKSHSSFCIFKNSLMPNENYRNVPEQSLAKKISWCVFYSPDNLLQAPRKGKMDYLMEVKTVLMDKQVMSLIYLLNRFSTPSIYFSFHF